MLGEIVTVTGWASDDAQRNALEVRIAVQVLALDSDRDAVDRSKLDGLQGGADVSVPDRDNAQLRENRIRYE
jgi:hypothetical protein